MRKREFQVLGILIHWTDIIEPLLIPKMFELFLKRECLPFAFRFAVVNSNFFIL